MRISLVLLLSACTAGETYLVKPDVAQSLRQMSTEERATLAVPAERGKLETPVTVRGETLQLDRATPLADGRLRMKAKRYSPMVAAGSALTWIGTGIAYVGVGMFAARFQQRDEIFTAGWATRVAIEPVLLIGTALWVLGAKARPQEAVAGRQLLSPIALSGNAPPP